MLLNLSKISLLYSLLLTNQSSLCLMLCPLRQVHQKFTTMWQQVLMELLVVTDSSWDLFLLMTPLPSSMTIRFWKLLAFVWVQEWEGDKDCLCNWNLDHPSLNKKPQIDHFNQSFEGQVMRWFSYWRRALLIEGHLSELSSDMWLDNTHVDHFHIIIKKWTCINSFFIQTDAYLVNGPLPW